MRLIIAGLCFSIFLALSANAEDAEEVDVLELRYGDLLYGTILEELEEDLLFKTTEGEVILIELSDIRERRLSKKGEAVVSEELMEVGLWLQVAGWTCIAGAAAMIVNGLWEIFWIVLIEEFSDQHIELSTRSVVFLAMGGLLIPVGITLYFAGRSKKVKYRMQMMEVQKKEGLSLFPVVGPGFSGLQLRWTF